MAVGTNGPPVLSGSAYVYPEETLAELRVQMLTLLGYAAMLSSPPPGITETLNSFLQVSQDMLYRRYPTLRQERWWTITTIQGSRFYDVPYSGSYLAGNDIAVVNGSPDSLTTVSGDFTAAGFTTGMVINLTGSVADDGLHTLGTVGTTVAELATTLTVIGETAGRLITVKEQGFKNLDMQEINYVGMLDGTIWNDMIPGINPLLFNITGQQRPTNYEIREYIEVFPEPDQAYVIYLKGRTGLMPFTADTDVTSVDPSVLFLQALANAKAHYGQGDARVYFQQLEEHLGSMNATTFGANRYIPEPDPPVPNLPYPVLNPPRT